MLLLRGVLLRTGRLLDLMTFTDFVRSGKGVYFKVLEALKMAQPGSIFAWMFRAVCIHCRRW